MSPWLQQVSSLINTRKLPMQPGARKAFESGECNRQAVLDAITNGIKNITDVAMETGISRETVGRHFSTLRAEGKIRKVAYAHWEAIGAAGAIGDTGAWGNQPEGEKIARRGQSAPARHG